MGAHGLRGQLRVRIFGDGPGNLLCAPEVGLAGDAEEASPRWFEVASAAAGRQGEVRLGLAGVKDREQAEALKGKLVLGRPEGLEPLPPGEHYWYELVGCRVQDAEGREIGTVREIWETGAHDVLVVEDESGAQHLVPTAREFLREVDVDARRVVIEAIPGLLETT